MVWLLFYRQGDRGQLQKTIAGYTYEGYDGKQLKDFAKNGFFKVTTLPHHQFQGKIPVREHERTLREQAASGFHSKGSLQILHGSHGTHCKAMFLQSASMGILGMPEYHQEKHMLYEEMVRLTGVTIPYEFYVGTLEPMYMSLPDMDKREFATLMKPSLEARFPKNSTLDEQIFLSDGSKNACGNFIGRYVTVIDDHMDIATGNRMITCKELTPGLEKYLAKEKDLYSSCSAFLTTTPHVRITVSG